MHIKLVDFGNAEDFKPEETMTEVLGSVEMNILKLLLTFPHCSYFTLLLKCWIENTLKNAMFGHAESSFTFF